MQQEFGALSGELGELVMTELLRTNPVDISHVNWRTDCENRVNKLSCRDDRGYC